MISYQHINDYLYKIKCNIDNLDQLMVDYFCETINNDKCCIIALNYFVYFN